MKRLNLSASLGVAVREFPTSTGEVDYALFVDGKPVGVVEAKREEAGEHITDVEVQSGRYAINNLDQSFADNRPKALVQMATGAGKTFTAITAAYRLLKYGNVLKSGMR